MKQGVKNETLESHSRNPGFESLCAHKDEPDWLIFFYDCFLREELTNVNPMCDKKTSLAARDFLFQYFCLL